ncbi:unnamed protein product [Lymnaea stagnalis]|uniref:Pentatricopeptide repeat-containing protein 1, mitochondrial n=1 Tax=Lymnaea stagnalis TaxID=6523 RepID=A0AAV2I300_LYMST
MATYVSLLSMAHAQLLMLSRRHNIFTFNRKILYFHLNVLNSKFSTSQQSLEKNQSTNFKKNTQKMLNPAKQTELLGDKNPAVITSKPINTEISNDSSKPIKSFNVKNNKKYSTSEYFKQTWLSHISTTSVAQDDAVKVHGKQNLLSADAFGTLATESSKMDLRDPNERLEEALPEDQDEPRDRRLDIPLTRDGRIGKNAFYYTRKMSILGREGKVKEAISMFEDIMMLRDRVMPNKRTFIVLIGILGRVGYTKKAFELYSKMKHLGLDPEDHIYTSLFNACANSPYPADGLRKAQDLLHYLQDEGIKPNLFTIKAAMKAFALCGDFPMAFTLMDRASTWARLDSDCFNHLLIACAADKQKGFLRALQVWQKLNVYRVKPATNTYNLLIRCARDCGIGDPTTFAKSLGLSLPDVSLIGDACILGDGAVMKSWRDKIPQAQKINRLTAGSSNPQPQTGLNANKKEMVKLTKVDDQHTVAVSTSSNKISENITVTDCRELTLATGPEEIHKSCESSKSDTTCQLYSEVLTTGSTDNALQEGLSRNISVKDLRNPQGRLAVLGGLGNLVTHMNEVGAPPDVKTFTQILACLPDDEVSEFELLTCMTTNGITPDIDLLNDIMMRRNKRHKSDTVMALLPVMSKLKLTPNMRTYAALALACHKESQAHKLIEDMRAANLEPNAEIVGHFIYISRSNYVYKLHMLKTLDKLCLKPVKETIAVIEKSIAWTKMKIIEAEKSKDKTSFYLSEPFQLSFQNFLNFYRVWLLHTEMRKSKDPWEGFETSRTELKSQVEKQSL